MKVSHIVRITLREKTQSQLGQHVNDQDDVDGGSVAQ